MILAEIQNGNVFFAQGNLCCSLSVDQLVDTFEGLPVYSTCGMMINEGSAALADINETSDICWILL